MLVYYGMKKNHAKFNHVSIKEGIQGMKDTVKEGQGKGLFHRLIKTREAFGVLVNRGEWEQEDHHEKKDAVHTSFVDRYGSLFDSHHRKAWWYGFWAMFRGLAVGVILAAVFNPERNAGGMLTIGVVDFILHTLFQPDGDWFEVAKNFYRGVMNIALISSVIGFINGSIPENVYTNVFQLIGIITMVPMIITSLFGPLISAFSCLGSLGGVGGAVAGGGAMMAAGAVVGGGLDHEAIFDAVNEANEEADEGKEAKKEQQERGLNSAGNNNNNNGNQASRQGSVAQSGSIPRNMPGGVETNMPGSVAGSISRPHNVGNVGNVSAPGWNYGNMQGGYNNNGGFNGGFFAGGYMGASSGPMVFQTQPRY